MKPESKKLILLFLSAIVLALISHLFTDNTWFHLSTEKQAKKLQNQLREKETLLEKKLIEFEKSTTEKGFQTGFENLFEEEGITLLAYENNKLKFWSNNSVPVFNELTPRRSFESQFEHFGNGWYLYKKIEKQGKTYIGLLLVKNKYPFENKYLKNDFNKCLNIDHGFDITIQKSTKNPEIRSKEDSYLFSLKKSESHASSDIHQILSALLFLTGLVFLLLFFYRLTAQNKFGTILFSLIIIALRAGMIYLKFPTSLYSLSLFDPSYHASSTWFPSLGDFLLNALAILCVTLLFSVRAGKQTNKNVLAGALILLLTMSLHFPVSYLIERLITDSDISFTINNLFTLNAFSYTGLFIVWLLIVTWFIAVSSSIKFLSNNSLNEKVVSYLLATTVLFLISFSTTHDWKAVGIMVLITGAMIALNLREKKSYSVFSSAFLLLGFSIYAAYSISEFHKEKTETKAKFFAEKLAAEEDPVAEYIFSELSAEIENDRVIKNQLTLLPQTKEDFFTRVEQKYLTEYLQKYEVRITVFNSNDSLIASTVNSESDINFFRELEQKGKLTPSRSLFYCHELNNDVNYLGKIVFINNRESYQKTTTAYIEFEEKITRQQLGFPELLLDRNFDVDKDLDEYSFAVYKDGVILSSHGVFSYSKDAPSVQLHEHKYEFKSSGGWRHLFFKPNAETLIILSRPQPDVFQKLTGVSFLFLLFSVFLLVSLLVYTLLNRSKNDVKNFRNRINLSVISILTVFLVLIGLSTIYFVRSEYQAKNVQAIREKINSVLIELESKSAKNENLFSDPGQLSFILNKFSKVFFTDINLFDTNGKLIVSTRMRLFDIGLISDNMDTEACLSMFVQKKTLFVQNEHIGELEYLSAYSALTNEKGEITAYLNLPYFAKQSAFQNEILTLVSALVNVYVLLIIIAVVVALFISRKITEPFEVIAKNIQQVTLGTENKPIEWHSDDEIGRLVSEYNNMIQKLGESAENLAKSERESAWREMAKQVAHEIKNPLTPMKLSVQQLERSYKEQKPGWDKNIERMTQTMIEQIDTLAHIASEFSNFAKMPRANNQKLNVADALMNVAELFRETGNASITFHSENKDLWIFADREQMQRVFTNLVKNAIQSIPETRQGTILIELQQENEFALVKITDNGSGINEEMKEKIFTPNFTTKSTGMGLGLAMVKNIIETSGGEIWFTTEENKGTTFIIKLPLLIE